MNRRYQYSMLREMFQEGKKKKKKLWQKAKKDSNERKVTQWCQTERDKGSEETENLSLKEKENRTLQQYLTIHIGTYYL